MSVKAPIISTKKTFIDSMNRKDKEIDCIWRELETYKKNIVIESCNTSANDYGYDINTNECVETKHIRALSFKVGSDYKCKRNIFNEDKKYTSACNIHSKNISKNNKLTKEILDDFRNKKTLCMTYCSPDTDENVCVADLKPTAYYISRNKQAINNTDESTIKIIKGLYSSKSARGLPYKLKEDLEIKNKDKIMKLEQQTVTTKISNNVSQNKSKNNYFKVLHQNIDPRFVNLDENINSKCDLSEDISMDAPLPTSQYNLTHCMCKSEISDNQMDTHLCSNLSKVCGVYCKNLSPKQQFQAIFNSKTTNSRNKSEFYVVPASWWRQWCDYVNVEFATYAQLLQKYTSIATLNTEQQEMLNLKYRRPKARESCGDSLFEENRLEQTYEDLIFPNLEEGSKDQNYRDTLNRESEQLKTHQGCDNSCNTPNTEDNFYTRPGKIINKNLIDFSRRLKTKVSSVLINSVNYSLSDCMRSKMLTNSSTNYPLKISLKNNIQEMYDFVKIDKSGWRLIKSWYDYHYYFIFSGLSSTVRFCDPSARMRSRVFEFISLVSVNSYTSLGIAKISI